MQPNAAFDADSDFSAPNNKIKETLTEKHKLIEKVFFYRRYNIYSYKVNKD